MRHIFVPVTEELRAFIKRLNDIFHRFDKEGVMNKVENLRGLITDLELVTKGLRDLLRQLEAEEAADKEVIRAAETPEPALQAVTDSVDVDQDQSPPIAETPVDNRPAAD